MCGGIRLPSLAKSDLPESCVVLLSVRWQNRLFEKSFRGAAQPNVKRLEEITHEQKPLIAPCPPLHSNDTSTHVRIGKTIAHPPISVHRGLQVREHRDHSWVRLDGVSRRSEGCSDDRGGGKRAHRFPLQRQPDSRRVFPGRPQQRPRLRRGE